MKLNINKEKLVKHKFWILFGIAFPLVLAGLFVLLSPVTAEIDNDKKKALRVLNSLKDFKPPFFNKENIDEKLKQVALSKEQEEAEWKKVYELQVKDDSLFWPTTIEETYKVHTGKFLRELRYLTGGDSPPNDDNHVTGKLVDLKNAYLTIRTKNKGKDEDVRVYRLGNDMMKLDGGRSYFKLPLDKDVQVAFQTGWYFYDQLSKDQWSDYAASYETQIRPLLDIVEPVNEDGEGVVQLRDWPYPGKKRPQELPPRNAKFLRFVTPPWDTSADISKEAWLAQEDLWIQKEIYRLIRNANDYVGKMKGEAVKVANQTATYANPYFELKLKLLDGNKLEATIKNLQPYRQKLDISFRARFSDARSYIGPEVFKIEGEPLDPKGAKDLKGLPKDTLTKVINLPKLETPRTMIGGVEQVLTWETAAVRRIDDIVIGASAEGSALNHRVFPEGIKAFGLEEKKEKDKDGDAAPAAAGGMPKVRAGGPEDFGFDGKGNAKRGKNGLIETRYSEATTKQTRRIPVAISLIVDQDHIDRVLTSFGNSKFRFLLNQILVNRYPLSVRPQIVTKEKQSGLDLPGLKKGPAGLRPGMAAPGTDEEMESNVELVIYGTMTLYQRFPPVPEAIEAAAKAGPP